MTTAKEKVALVVTSIAAPNATLASLARGCVEHGYEFIVIGDEASPRDFQLEGCRFYSLEEQRALGLELASLCPTRHYARKNLGYLMAMRHGATLIIETDDDNIPYSDFWRARRRHQTVRTAMNAGWLNVYRYFSDAEIWPRGFPLEHIKDSSPSFESLAIQDVDCPIQQGLADEDPDVDAVYRLVGALPQSFRANPPVALSQGAWCPFNSQNTAWWRAAFPLMYLPAHCSFRMTDIWRSFVAQRVAWTNDWNVLFEKPTARQERNEHDLLRDFRDEVPGYLHNAAICEALSELSLPAGEDAIWDNLRSCYEKLVELQFIDAREVELVEAWIADVKELSDSQLSAA
jgi:hypothetical protein